VIVSIIEGIELYANSKRLATRRLGTACLPFPPEQQIEVRRARGQLDWSAEEVDASAGDLSQAELERARRLLSAAARSELADLRDRPLLEAMRLLTARGSLTNAAVLLFGTEELIRQHVPAHGYSYQYRPSPGSEATYSTRGARAVPAAVEALLDLVERRAESRPLNLSGGVQLSLVDYPSDAVSAPCPSWLVDTSWIPAAHPQRCALDDRGRRIARDAALDGPRACSPR
jgi:ATP-dependent DNA helicase RecG